MFIHIAAGFDILGWVLSEVHGLSWDHWAGLLGFISWSLILAVYLRQIMLLKGSEKRVEACTILWSLGTAQTQCHFTTSTSQAKLEVGSLAQGQGVGK